MTPPDEQAARRNPWVVFVVWIAASAGLAGILGTVGFLTTEAYEDLLGYHISESSGFTGYVFVAGELVMSGFVATLSLISQHRVPAALLLLLLVLVLVVPRLRIVRDRNWHVPREALVVGWAFATVLHLAWLDLPTVYVRDMLVDGGAAAIPGDSSVITNGARQLREEHICSRAVLSDSLRAALKRQHAVDCDRSETEYAGRLRDRFALNFVLGLTSVLVLIWSIRVIALGEAAAGKPPPWTLPLIVSSFVFLVDVCALPYQYGKVARSTSVHYATLHFTMGDSAKAENGFLLTSGTMVTFYHEERRYIWSVPQENVTLIEVLRPDDVLRNHLTNSVPPAASDTAQSTPLPPM